MTPSQTQALQEVKDEVAKEKTYLGSHNKNCKNWDDFLNDRIYEESLVEINKAIQEVAELYHTRLLAEAGKDVKFLRDEFYKENTRLESDGKIVEFKRMPHYVFQWFEEKASTLIAAKQAEVEGLKLEVAKFRIGLQEIQSLNKEAKNIRSNIYNTDKPQ